MQGRVCNQLVVIENEKLSVIRLDDKPLWEIGRPSRDNHPDICLHSVTVSRRHGRLQNMDGVWFYLDYNGKNGTVYNDKKILPGLRGRVRPIALSDGDVLVFGGGEETAINDKTVWALYSTTFYEDKWRVADTRGYRRIAVRDSDGAAIYEHPAKGLVVQRQDGMVIYMGDLSYEVGAVRLAEK